MKNEAEEEDLRRYKKELRAHALKQIANSSKNCEQRMRKMLANCNKLRQKFEKSDESIRELKARGWSADKLVNAYSVVGNETEWGHVSPGNVLPLNIFLRNALDGDYDGFLLGHRRQSVH